MYRVLFMPLLQIPSGHHHVADCIKEQLDQYSGVFECEKVEVLSYCFGKLETLVSNVYLQWIHKLPHLYSQIYKNAAVKNAKTNRLVTAYEWLFLKKILHLLRQIKPDIIICTHAFPSYLLNYFKSENLWSGKVINVYTDYFVNNLWGVHHIDYHFVPSQHVKQELINKGVNEQQIFISGIPIHPIFNNPKSPIEKSKSVVLISGGNLGVGSILQLLQRLNPSGAIQYKVLCGKNPILFDYLTKLNHPNILPVPYIDSKKEMNVLYEEADAILTKPGGVTITECLWKRLPIFVYEALPGQEEYNLEYLKEQGLVFHLDNWNSSANIEKIIIHCMKNKLVRFYKNTDRFHHSLEDHNILNIIRNIMLDKNRLIN
ncbi:hypothetical protein GLW20_03925 [Virgibacillus halodenitrificans]|nr:hypothetical protein [Virgibacillus halodenitrificans]